MSLDITSPDLTDECHARLLNECALQEKLDALAEDLDLTNSRDQKELLDRIDAESAEIPGDAIVEYVVEVRDVSSSKVISQIKDRGSLGVRMHWARQQHVRRQSIVISTTSKESVSA